MCGGAYGRLPAVDEDEDVVGADAEDEVDRDDREEDVLLPADGVEEERERQRHQDLVHADEGEDDRAGVEPAEGEDEDDRPHRGLASPSASSATPSTSAPSTGSRRSSPCGSPMWRAFAGVAETSFIAVLRAFVTAFAWPLTSIWNWSTILVVG